MFRIQQTDTFAEWLANLRVRVGPGYRVYFAHTGRVVLLLLFGRDKSTQKRDIERAKRLLRDSKED